MPYIIPCIQFGIRLVREYPVCGGGSFVYNADRVRQLCAEIVEEKDPEKAKNLIPLL
jgi:hypothetical protein